MPLEEICPIPTRFLTVSRSFRVGAWALIYMQVFWVAQDKDG